MKKIVLFTLGGTISAKGKNRLDLKDYTSGLIQGDTYLQVIPELTDLAEITIVSLDNITSTDINETHWIKLKMQIEKYLENENYDGAIISHGTNTLEETAYFLHLTVNTAKPVVLVGAQRPFTALSSDAPLNLIQAIHVAIHPDSANKGVLVLFNQKIHSAREVSKVETYNVDAFDSGDFGCLGIVDAGYDVLYYRETTRKHTTSSSFHELRTDTLANVEIVYSYAGASGNLIQYISESGKYEGIVVAGTGAGRFSRLEENALIEATNKGLTIVRSNRVGNGHVLPIDAFQHMDTIHAADLNPQKARILLSLALKQTKDLSVIQGIFNEY